MMCKTNLMWLQVNSSLTFITKLMFKYRVKSYKIPKLPMTLVTKNCSGSMFMRPGLSEGGYGSSDPVVQES